ncbi:XRE family transcriptional regulator [Streptomyces sp. VNUA116]|uniref:telomere-protecting terminal protein Tpg n=1 Tax=Streptomyces sp. VNUA116 TaxID=3062449 RepID=UPI00267619CA|nr:XRE family transcriptional regulator [Streptomyces sp. VNUA116]WKU42639.1 XRE family transcriptional regulator [Streptomyces sp. VNUA116]
MARRIQPRNADTDDALVADAVERASQETFTHDAPKTLQGQINFLMRTMKTAKAIAEEIGVTADSVNRYRRGTRKNPPKQIADRIEAAVKTRWQPRVRQRAKKKAATSTGITVETRAYFGYHAPIGTTDEARPRRITAHLSPEYARRLFDAQKGIGTQTPNEVIAEGLQKEYFQDYGRRASGLEVEFTGIDYIDFKF